jgi:hypothetical protein
LAERSDSAETRAEAGSGAAPRVAAASPRLRPLPGLIVGFALLPPTVLWLVYNETVLAGALATQMSLPLNVVLELMLLVGANALVGRVRPRWRLSQPQLLIAYVVLVVGTAASGFWYTQALPVVSGYLAWYCTPEHPGGPTLAPGMDLSAIVYSLPTWFAVQDRPALQAFFEGADESTSAANYWRAWLIPMGWWVLLFVIFVTVFLCLAVLLRRQWADRERLNFPLTQVPLAMTDTAVPLFRNRLLWIGLVLAGSVDVINNLAMIYPAMPDLRVRYFDLASTINTWGFPWSQVGWGSFGISFYPFVVGLGFLMPLDLLFSFWFFYLFWNVVRIAVAALGFPYPGIGAEARFPYIADQVHGGYLALGVMALWASRKDFRYALDLLLRRAPPDPELREAISYPRALVGATVGIVALVLMLTAAGAPVLVAAAFVGGFLIISVTVTRLRAEFGAPFHDVEYNTPDFVLPKVLGSALLGPRALGVLSMQVWYSAENFTHPMPHGMEALRLGSVAKGATQRPFFWTVLFTWVVGMSLCLLVVLSLSYRWGYTSAHMLGQRTEWYGYTFSRLKTMLDTPTPPSPQSAIAVVVGMGACFGLQALRMRLPGFPLDPVAFSLASTATASSYWMPLLIAWILKTMILRYGGRRGYARALPFFLGLVMGEAVFGAGWSIIGCLLGRRTYQYYYF